MFSGIPRYFGKTHMRLTTRVARFIALFLIVASNANAAALPTNGVSMTMVTLIVAAIAIGAITAFLLYRGAHAKSQLNIDVLDVRKIEVDASRVLAEIREKVKKLPMNLESEAQVEAISKLVEEETNILLQDIKQEYTVKYQLIEQQKQQEVDLARKDYHAVKEKFESTQQAYKQVEAEKKTTEAVVRSIADGLVVVNQKGEVLLMNPSAEKMLGMKNKKLGRSILDDVSDEVMISLTRDTSGGDKVIEFKAKDESTRRVLRSSSAVIQNENGQTVGMVNVLTDVTKQREVDDVKNKFVSNVTHELRTPIVAMQKATSLLLNQQAGPLTDTQQNFLSIVSRNLGHLSRLVEDLLDIAKLESGKMRFKMAPCRVERVINDVCDTLETWAKSKEIHIAREIDRSLPEIPCDPDKITQVLNNLIGNAVKFTPQNGKISVKCAWSADGAKAQISVADTGVGIEPENVAKLFGRFEQFGDQQGIMGTGLGLSIAKEIIERHGGAIGVTSEPKKGSTFTFTLPIKQHTNPQEIR